MDALNPRWTRLEPYSRDPSLQYGLNAEVHDPLWLLARQWQLLEFWGEDAGSPIWADLNVTYAPITRYHLHPQDKPPSQVNVVGQTLNGSVPLEALVEREAVREIGGKIPPLRLAAEAGLHFLRLLNARGAGELRAKAIADFPLKNPLTDLTEEEKKSWDSETVRFIEVMSGRVPDGRLLRAGVQSWSGVPTQHQAAVQATIKSWGTWYDRLFYEAQDSSWVPPRLEYQALIAVSTTKGEVVLNATEYADGHLDWYSFDAVAGPSLGAAPSDSSAIDTIIDTDPNKVAKRTVKRSLIPTPVKFPGMPVSRYWEFEDAKVDFGAIAAGEQQLAHLLLIEFGLVSGDDWFIIPVTLPVGTLCYTDTLTVLDTFGVPTTIPSTRALDQKRKNKDLSSGLSPWDLFHLSGDESKTDALFLPPTLGRSLQGKAIEEVLFMRDEMANMVWAVERTIEGALGRPLNQSEAYFRSRKEKTLPSGGPDANLIKLYKLASEVPSHWVPMLPVPINGNHLGLTTGRRPKGRVMTELWTVNQSGKPLYGEEVPREGVRVSRAYQYTRWTNGESYLWVGRKNEVGRGEGSSGLVFDQLVLPAPEPKDPNQT
ncbi:MAG: hypothetical protein OJF50_005941 [Nitrospira sp.]|nr:hypothetical protein [Nitrospira sp.]